MDANRMHIGAAASSVRSVRGRAGVVASDGRGLRAWIDFGREAGAARAARDVEGVARAFVLATMRTTGAMAGLVAWRSGDLAAGRPGESAGVDRVRIGDPGALPELLVADGLPDAVVELLRSVPFDVAAIASMEDVGIRPVADSVALDGQLVLAPLAAAGVASVVTTPLRNADGVLLGVARCFFREESSSVDLDRPLLATFAGQLVCATEGMALERRWHRAEARLDAVFAGSRDAFVELVDDGGIVRASRMTAGLLGHRAEALAGAALSQIVSRQDLPQARALLRRSAEPVRESGPREIEIVHADGAQILADASAQAIEGGGAMLVLADARERHAAEERARESDRLAAMGTLAAGLGHDMNNVLFPIRAHLNALSTAPSRMSVARRARHVAEIRHSVAYLQQLADSLHFLSMDPDGDGDGRGSTALAGWWSGCGALLSQSLRRAAELHVDLPESLPEVGIAPHALTRAMLNLLVNAAEAMPADRLPGESCVHLRARAGASGETVVLELEDNGTGMDQEVRRRALDMFFTTKPRGLGTGLGLPLVRRVVERAGGRLEIDSRPGAGTTIRLVLQAVGAVAEDDDVAPVACVEIADGRVRALVAMLVEARGLAIAGPAGPGDAPVAPDADLWIVDAASLDAIRLARWSAGGPERPVVVLGAWSAADPATDPPPCARIVADPTDLQSLSRALDAALGPSMNATG
jgi:PAS domain S-box-containing protein